MAMTYAELRALAESACRDLGAYSESAIRLLLGTAAVESAFGTYHTQRGGGPARGICQMEGPTFDDIFINYLAYKPSMMAKVHAQRPNLEAGMVDTLITDDYAAFMMARLQYYRRPEPLPADPTDVDGLAAFWKQWYNTPAGAGTTQKFLDAYALYVEPYLPVPATV